MNMKYIIFDMGGSDVPVIFPNTLSHADVARISRSQVVSAGFVHPCGCEAGLKMSFGTVYHPNIHPHWAPDSCAKDIGHWKERNE